MPIFSQVPGRLGRDAEIRETRNGTQYVSFSVAADRRKNDERGPIWVQVEAWNGVADRIVTYLTKGTPVLVSGLMDTNQYETKAGEQRFELKLNADRVEFLNFGNRNNDDAQGSSGGDRASAPAAANPQDWNNDDFYGGGEPNDVPWS